MKNSIIFPIALLLAAVIFLGLRTIDNPIPSADDKMRGVCWVGGDSVDIDNFNGLLETNVDWISQTPFGWQDGHANPKIAYGSDRVLWGESDRGIRHTTKLAKKRGLKTILKPHIWLRRSDGKWRADVEMNSPEEWDRWFESYTGFILHYAHIAQEADIEMLCIGTELTIPSTRYPDRWREIVRKVREVYDGKLTYAGNFYQEFENITWWDAVDYIGIQAYFPLCEHEDPALHDLKEGWHQHMSSIENVYRKYNRPVIFTEIGYRNESRSALEPWLWPNQIESENAVTNDELQARCYQAFFETCWQEEWMHGVFFWKWFHSTWRFPNRDAYIEHRQHRLDSLIAAGHSNLNRYRRWRRPFGFTPQGKPAEAVMREWFSRGSN